MRIRRERDFWAIDRGKHGVEGLAFSPPRELMAGGVSSDVTLEFHAHGFQERLSERAWQRFGEEVGDVLNAAKVNEF